jgi:Group II intron, maturase-specific domain
VSWAFCASTSAGRPPLRACRRWASYFQHAVAKHTFDRLSHFIWWRLVRWVKAQRRNDLSSCLDTPHVRARPCGCGPLGHVVRLITGAREARQGTDADLLPAHAGAGRSVTESAALAVAIARSCEPGDIAVMLENAGRTRSPAEAIELCQDHREDNEGKTVAESPKTRLKRLHPQEIKLPGRTDRGCPPPTASA